jgi:hypothetical protein
VRPSLVLVALSVVLATSSCTFTVNKQVELLPEHLACERDEDCVYARTECSSCGTSVSKQHAEALSAAAVRMCKRYRGDIVECLPQNPPRCEAGKCSVTPEPWDPEY